MRILITNTALAERAGSELYVRDLAFGLLKSGHHPIVYSPHLGEVAEEVSAAAICVTDNLDSIETPPDIIHGQHHLETMTALARFPGTPAIYMCHGAIPWEEAPPCFPRILRYVGVDIPCRERLVQDHSIPEDRVRVVLNFVDLDRFKPRSSLPARPRSALIFSNQANEDTHVRPIRSACRRAGLEVEVVGRSGGKVWAEPEMLLANYDIVFAKGRAALEAMSVGAAVILCDVFGAGPMVTTTNMRQLRPLNFGFRTLTEEVSRQAITRELARYDPADAARVCEFIRADAGRDAVIDQMLGLYEEVIMEHRQNPEIDPVAEQIALSSYLRGLAPRIWTLTQKEALLTGIQRSESWRLASRVINLKHRFSGGGTSFRIVRHTVNGKDIASAKRVFSEIYQENRWGNGESRSGPGSTVERAAAFSGELVSFFEEIKARTLLDAGCGDFNWMKRLELNSTEYIGVDVVPELVERNQKAYSNETRRFVKLDITRDELPRADVILCRDNLVHLSFRDIFAALKNFKRSGSTYLVTTTFTHFHPNSDIETGEWRRLNLQEFPFNFPDPERLIDEKSIEAGPDYGYKQLAVWALKDIPL